MQKKNPLTMPFLRLQNATLWDADTITTRQPHDNYTTTTRQLHIIINSTKYTYPLIIHKFTLVLSTDQGIKKRIPLCKRILHRNLNYPNCIKFRKTISHMMIKLV